MTTSHFCKQTNEINYYTGVVAQVHVQLSREVKELTASLDIDWHRPVGDRLNLFGIGAYAKRALNIRKKWYYDSRKYTLFEVGVHLELKHMLKNLKNVGSVNFHVCLAVRIPYIDEHIIKVTRCGI